MRRAPIMLAVSAARMTTARVLVFHSFGQNQAAILPFAGRNESGKTAAED